MFDGASYSIKKLLGIESSRISKSNRDFQDIKIGRCGECRKIITQMSHRVFWTQKPQTCSIH